MTTPKRLPEIGAPSYEVRWRNAPLGRYETLAQAVESAQAIISASWGKSAPEQATTYAVVELRVVETMVWQGGA